MKVEMQHLTKIFPSRDRKGSPVTAVNDFTFTVPDGELVALLGPSGCGKSTTLYMLSGLEKPTSGRILFGEDDVTDLPAENRGVGLVFQSYALYPHLTVEQNIRFPLENRRGAEKLSRTEMNERVREAAALVQLEELLARKPNELSGGQQQRVAIARAIVKMPRILLLDEPLSNLDARLRLQTREEIRRIQKKTGITTVFVTHDQEEAMSISDHIVVMCKGEVQQTGKPQEVYDDPTNLFVAKFLGTPPINMFRGTVHGGVLVLGQDEVLPVPGVRDGIVSVGVRPEGFIQAEDGALRCRLRNVEVMGRDVSIVAEHDALESAFLRAIVQSEQRLPTGTEVRFRLKPFKTLLFDPESGERLRFEVPEDGR